MGIEAAKIDGYESKEIWIRNRAFFSTMLIKIINSPLLSSNLSMIQLPSTMGGRPKAFRHEEIRAASAKPEKIDISDSSQTVNYYTRALLSLNPTLLPKISLVTRRSSLV